MNRTSKTILIAAAGGVAVSILLCILVIFVLARFITQNAIVGDPARIGEIGAKVADYTIPAGYHEQFGQDLFIAQEVIIAPMNHHGPNIMLLQRMRAMSDAQAAQMQQTLQKAYQNQYHLGLEPFEQLGEEVVSIKGQPVVLTVLENKTGTLRVRQEYGAFNGKSGLAMLMVIGSVEEWNPDVIHVFAASIR